MPCDDTKVVGEASNSRPEECKYLVEDGVLEASSRENALKIMVALSDCYEDVTVLKENI